MARSFTWRGWAARAPDCDLTPLICLAWMILGLIPLGYFMIRDRARIAEIQRIFTEQTPAEHESI